MSISKFTIAVTGLFFSTTLFLSYANAAAETFKVEAEYKRPDFSDRGIDVKLSQIIDRTVYTIEVKTEHLQVIANILSVEESKTTYHEDMKPDFTLGEYCSGTQMPVGEYDAFKLKETPSAQAILIREPVQLPGIPKPPGTPGAVPGFPQGRASYKITTLINGVEHLRGWNFSFENILCNLKNIPEEDSAPLINTSLEFDSKDLKTSDKALVIDKTENGFGWIFTVTRLPLN